jgi:hypothetical protein
MKSFDKFQHGRTGLHEMKIFKKMSSTGVKQSAVNNPALKKTLDADVRNPTNQKALPSSSQSTGPQRQQRAKAMGQKAGLFTALCLTPVEDIFLKIFIS